MIAAAILKAIEKLREEGETSRSGGEKKGKSRQPLPWNHFLTYCNSVSFNVRDDWRTLMSLFDILYIFVIFKCNFRSIWRSRAGHKHKFWCRQARYLVYKCIVAYWFTLQTLAPPPTFLARQKFKIRKIMLNLAVVDWGNTCKVVIY